MGTVDDAVVIVHRAEGNVKLAMVYGGSAYGSVPEHLTGGGEIFFSGSGGVSLPGMQKANESRAGSHHCAVFVKFLFHGK